MIVKPWETGPDHADPMVRAGAAAERQLAFYLHRAFHARPELFVLNNLRLVDPQQPEQDGRAGVCQIDHLVLHRRGAFIIESKSVSGQISVRGDGAGGDEWSRLHSGRQCGMASPIQQAKRQGEFLRAYLQRHREHLLGKVAPGVRLLTRLVAGTDQRGFRKFPIQIVVAISDGGTIDRVGGWQEPSEPFQTFLTKADLVPEKVRGEFERHHKATGLLSRPGAAGEYGIWSMPLDEVSVVAEFLRDNHVPPNEVVAVTKPAAPIGPRPTPRRADRISAPQAPATPHSKRSPDPTVEAATQAVTPNGATCRGCQGSALAARWGKFGYYWKCSACGVNTPMPQTCPACGAQGRRGEGVRVRKDGPKYWLHCDHCSREVCLWTE